MFHTALALLCAEHGGKWEEWRERVRIAACGDDVIVAISEDICSVVDPEEWISAYAKMGMTATSGRKNGVMAYGTLEECVFLKRTFDSVATPDTKLGPTTISAKLAFASIYKRFTFARQLDYSDPNDVDEIKQLKRTALMELARHGREAYDKHREKIERMFSGHGNIVNATWGAMWRAGLKACLAQRDLSQPFGTLFHLNQQHG
jgi:hypothetical protein